jgi:hypothetical protein
VTNVAACTGPDRAAARGRRDHRRLDQAADTRGEYRVFRGGRGRGGPVYNIAQFLDDPHVQERAVVVVLPDEDIGELPMHNVVPRFSRTRLLAEFVDVVEARQGLLPGNTAFIAMIETPEAFPRVCGKLPPPTRASWP